MNKSVVESVTHLPSSPEARKRRRDYLLPTALALGTVATAAITAWGPSVAHSVEHAMGTTSRAVYGPTFSDETTTKEADPRDTPWDIAGEVDDPNDHANRGEIRTYIVNMPENKQTFEDGMLSEGESITRPDYVE